MEESNAAILKDSLESNRNIIKVDIRNNQMSEQTVEEIDEIVMRNYLAFSKLAQKK